MFGEANFLGTIFDPSTGFTRLLSKNKGKERPEACLLRYAALHFIKEMVSREPSRMALLGAVLKK